MGFAKENARHFLKSSLNKVSENTIHADMGFDVCGERNHVVVFFLVLVSGS